MTTNPMMTGKREAMVTGGVGSPLTSTELVPSPSTSNSLALGVGMETGK